VQCLNANLLYKVAVGNWLSSELDVQRISPRHSRRVQDADCTVAVVNHVNVNVAAAGAADVASDVTVSGVGCVDVDDAFLADRNSGPDAI
jgi:hypothetical protein